ncbi:hypothetical protein EVAR_21542_1 [Eumeta japonica]|uniref:Uncharacterized protein n=1 Tax=Eumeta variegata TaxID=151549 RepID=A0A4C1UXN7_EUMVA|nr:hypothetical protein EVAR_21542_1 [Eumeta japonica]
MSHRSRVLERQWSFAVRAWVIYNASVSDAAVARVDILAGYFESFRIENNFILDIIINILIKDDARSCRRGGLASLVKASAPAALLYGLGCLAGGGGCVYLCASYLYRDPLEGYKAFVHVKNDMSFLSILTPPSPRHNTKSSWNAVGCHKSNKKSNPPLSSHIPLFISYSVVFESVADHLSAPETSVEHRRIPSLWNRSVFRLRPAVVNTAKAVVRGASRPMIHLSWNSEIVQTHLNNRERTDGRDKTFALAPRPRVQSPRDTPCGRASPHPPREYTARRGRVFRSWIRVR